MKSQLRRASSALALIAMLAAPSVGLAQGPVTYSYDALGRVTRAVYPDGTTTTYTYDKAGNRTNVTTAQGDHPPTAVNDGSPTSPFATIDAGSSATLQVLSNDTDPDPGDVNNLVVFSRTDGAKGTTQISSDGKSVIYTAGAGQSGDDSFTYTAADSSGVASNPATVYVTIGSPTSGPPTVSQAAPIYVAPGATGTSSFTVTGAYTSTQGGGPDSYGTSYVNGTQLSYTANASAPLGTTTWFNYQAVGPGGTSAPGTETVYITNQPPAQAPIANASSASVATNSSNNTLTPSFSGGTPTSVAVATPASYGSVSASGTNFIYTPNANFSGADSFTFTGTNSAGTSSPATFTVNVGTAAAPTVTPNVDMYVAPGGTTTANFTVTGSYTQTEGGGTSTYGTSTVSGTTLTYTANSNAPSGVTDYFNYQAVGPGGTSAPGTAAVHIDQSQGTAPTVTPNVDMYVAPGGTTTGTFTVTGSYTQTEGGGTSTYGTSTVSGTTLTYTANANAPSGVTDYFNYQATGPGGTSTPGTAAVHISSQSQTQAPVGVTSSASVAYDSSNNTLTPSFSGGAPTSVAVATPAQYGSVSASGTNFIYTPNTGFSGPDSFTFTGTNSAGTSSPATFNITVDTQALTANNSSASVAYNSSNNTLTPSFSGTPTSVSVVNPPGNGTVSVSGTNFIYTPHTGFSGPDSFTFNGSNGGTPSNTATFNITVGAQAFTANDGSATVAFDSSNNSLTPSFSSTPTSVSVVSPPGNGTVSVSGTNFIYTPKAGYYGTDSFTFNGSNGGPASNTATYNITIPQPAAPTVSNLDLYVNAGQTATGTLTIGGYYDSTSGGVQDSYGSGRVNGTTVTYTADASVPTINDSFTATATGPGGSGSGTVTVHITGSSGNHDPTCPASRTLTTNAPGTSTVSVTVQPLSGPGTPCTDPDNDPLSISSVSAPNLPAGSSVTQNGNDVDVTRGPNGPVTFTYNVSDGKGGSTSGSFTVD